MRGRSLLVASRSLLSRIVDPRAGSSPRPLPRRHAQPRLFGLWQNWCRQCLRFAPHTYTGQGANGRAECVCNLCGSINPLAKKIGSERNI
ncbi:MAG: hypothetical protein QW057_06090 [Candidatus Bathyarchaeia archaeon]